MYYFLEQRMNFVIHSTHLVETGLFCFISVTLCTILLEGNGKVHSSKDHEGPEGS